MSLVARKEIQQAVYFSNINSAAGAHALLQGQDESEAELSLIMFEVGGSIFALPTMTVTEVVQVKEIVHIPQAPGFIEGVIEIREQVIPVVDLRKKLGYTAADIGHSIILIAIIAGKKTGFVVDAARKVLSFLTEELHDIAPILTGSERRYVYRTVSRNNEPIVILNIETLLNDQELSSMESTLEEVA